MSMSVLMAGTLVAMVCLSSVSCLPSDVIRQQRQELKNLSCEPKAVAVHIPNLLRFHDALVDKEYFPKVVAVKRCLQNNSFCGNHLLGVQSGQCQPDPQGIVSRPLFVYYYEDGEQKFQEVLVPEHRACTCSA